MIRGFKDVRTKELSEGIVRKGTPPDVAKVAKRKITMLAAAVNLHDLASPPGNELEPLYDDLLGYHSIRVNDQWRIVFRWNDAGVEEVWFTDYHKG